MPLPSANAARARFPFTLPGVLLIVAGYALVHATTRLLASGNLGEDDPLDNLLIQTLAPGYSLEHGPLYDWLLWLLQQVLGTELRTFLTLKYGLLIAMAGCLFAITRRLTSSALWGFVAVESMATVYQIFWRFHEGFTHRAGAMALVAITLWATLRAVERPSVGNRLLLAALLGAGLLSEPIYMLFVAAVIIAAWPQPTIRHALLSPGMLAVLPLTAAIVAPYALWLTAEPGRASAFLAGLLPAIPSPNLRGIGNGLRDALTFPIFVLAPWSVIVPLTFPAVFRAIRRPPVAEAPNLTGFIGRVLLIQVTVHVAFNGIVFAKAGYPVHSILPMMIIAIPWLTAKIAQTAPTPKRVRVYMAILLAFTITAYAVRSGNLFVYEPFCSRCRWGTPYAGLADRLRDMGFTSGTIITNDVHTGGNLRRFFPDSRIVLNHADDAAPATGQLARVWLVPGERTLPPELATAAGQPQWLEVPWHAPFKPEGYRHTTWAAAVEPAR